MNRYGVVTSPSTVKIERLLPGPIERVWQYLTDPDKRRQWLAGGEMQQRHGGRVELIFRNSELSENGDLPSMKYADCAGEVSIFGEILACQPPHVLAYTWGDDNSEVRFELSAEAEQVRLTVVHSRLPSREHMISVASGWHTHLDILVDVLANRAHASFWSTHNQLEAEYERRIAVT